MRHLIGHIDITPDKIIIFKQVFAVVDSEYNSPCYIQGSTSTDADDTIPMGKIIDLSSFIHIRLDRIFMNVEKYFF